MKDKSILNFIVIIVLSFLTFWWTFFVFHMPFDFKLVWTVIAIRSIASYVIYNDYSMSWSKASQKTFITKSIVYIIAFIVYLPIFYGDVWIYMLVSELFLYLFSINFSMYLYYFFVNRNKTHKTKSLVIYGAGNAGVKLKAEFISSEYKTVYFIDDDKAVQNRSIDSIRIISKDTLKKKLGNKKFDLLVIAMPSVSRDRVKEMYDSLSKYFTEIKILPSIDKILNNKDFSTQLKSVSVEDLLARHPQDLDKDKISSFINNKIVLVTGAGGSIGSEICRQCIKFGAKRLILVDHSEFNLYQVEQELQTEDIMLVMQSVTDKNSLKETFDKYRPNIVIHAAAYKHVPLVESNISEAIVNNVVGTKNTIDCAIESGVEKFILISTDKAVRPTNVMGTTKRICELYAQNAVSLKDRENTLTDIVAVRFGNVLGSSGSVIPKFRSQIENGQNITVTHPDITRYFMLIPEACELVLQAGAIGKGGEIFILDMGEPIKIVDLAKKMIELSGAKDIKIEFSGLRPGEKLYEELLIDDADCSTEYKSITVAKPTFYDIEKLNNDIEELVQSSDKLAKLKDIVPEFNHQPN